MTVVSDKAEQACQKISRQILEAVGTLHMHYILYHDGEESEALSTAETPFAHHPAAKTAAHLIKPAKGNNVSRILGTASAQEHLFWGLIKRESFLTLSSINIDRFEKIAELRREAYALAWHAIDTVRYSDQAQRLRRGDSDILVRKRSALQVARANLQADMFSALICHLQGDKNAINELGRKRASESLSNIARHRSDLYPFPLVVETVNFAVSQWQYETLSPRKAFALAEKITEEVLHTLEDDALKNWLIFSESSQDMTWRGFSREEILSAAINTSEDTHIRSTAYLVSELTGITPASVLAAQNKYSAFSDDAFNADLHYNMMRQTFEDIIARGMEDQSAAPFIEAANKQNIELTHGQTIGWCASALHDTARMFEQALNEGYDPEKLTRKHFEQRKDKTSWQDLKQLSNKIVEKSWSGEMIDLESLKDICGESGNAGLSSISQSIQATLDSPQYQQKYAVANELNVIPAAAKPAMEIAPKVAPQAPATPAVSAPSIGLGGGNRVQRPPVTTTTTETSGSGDQQQQ